MSQVQVVPTHATASNAAQPGGAPQVPHAVLENLAARFRPAGLFLLMLRPDGSVAYHDGSAGTFFTRYVLPMLQYPERADTGLRGQAQQLNASSTVGIWDALPGVLLAAFPYVEKRQLGGILVLGAKNASFRLNEDVIRVCGRLGVDGVWLSQQADQLPAYADEAIQRQARMLLAMVRDQVRLTGMETEIESLSGQLADTYEELSLIYQISGGMRVNRRAGDFFKQACLDVLDVMNIRGMGVSLRGAESMKHDPVIYGQVALPPGQIFRLSDNLMAIMQERKAPLLINELAKDPMLGWMSEHARSLLVVPLQRQDKVLGCLFAIDKHDGEFNSVDSKLLASISNESAIYLENAILFEDVHRLMMGIIRSLTSAIDAKDAYTCGHSERVALISRTLAKEAGLPEADVDRIYMGGLLHDVGKIGVPEVVLQKAGRLTPEEFEQMKKHPQIGAHILADLKQVADIVPGVLHHHERFDGKGYPYGLSGEQIPIMGRIICLADCFDAMTSNRTYRKALPLEVALAEIRRCGGTQFDPRLTEFFLNIGIDRLRCILRDHQSTAESAKAA
ncbi:MAG TPA: HD domain-containing phosphohydrolase [Tepidisphaeraceae bacterium]|jgi:putative nucleotidyltransferase with HDIG domain|nr:HD domain-containing phosphohydrolase [Tepidisphaeraceae bacterium]